jgi:hypothetical protein
VTGVIPASLAERYSVIADLLVPGDVLMPSATEADPGGAWRDRAFAARPDLADLVVRLLTECGKSDPSEFLASLQQTRPDDFEALNFLVIATYFMNPSVRMRLGRFAEPARPVLRGEAYRDLESGILDPVASRGLSWREAP